MEIIDPVFIGVDKVNKRVITMSVNKVDIPVGLEIHIVDKEFWEKQDYKNLKYIVSDGGITITPI